MANLKVDPNHPLPLYYLVYRSLLERIEEGEFAGDNLLPPERQLVEDYSVSRITIIKALAELEREGRVDRQQGRGTFVIPPAQLQIANGNKPTMISFFCRLVSHPVLVDISSGIALATEHHAQYLQILNAYDTQGRTSDVEFIDAALSLGTRGLIIYPSVGDAHAALARGLLERGVPVVMVERYFPAVPTDRVVFNDEGAAHMLTSHLIRRGHRRIVVILPKFEMTITTIYDRLKGYRQALEDYGLAFDDELVWADLDFAFYTAEDPVKAQEEVARRLMNRIEGERPTAILCLNNDITDSLYHNLKNSSDLLKSFSGMESDFEMATFSRVESSPDWPFPISTAIHSGRELGAAAAHLLFGRLDGSVTGPARTITVPMKIVFPENESGETLKA